jgi:predicted phosphodiesterase
MDKEQTQHELICALKQLTGELGRVPSRDEFVKKCGTRHKLINTFPTYTDLRLAAGYAPAPNKITNAVFETNVERQVENHKPPKRIEHKPYPTIACISDLHWPFCDIRAIKKFIEFVADKKPEWVIINGDAWDMYSHSKFPRSHNLFTPREEQKLARKMNEDFWAEIKKASPESKCVQMLGNHDLRPLKKALEIYPAAEDWIEKAMQEAFTFSGVKTIYDPREELTLGEDILVFHGYRTQLGAHRDYTLFNCINAHSHVGGCVFKHLRGQTLWELNTGYAGDPTAKGLTYTPQKITQMTPGFGYVDSLGPRFIPV